MSGRSEAARGANAGAAAEAASQCRLQKFLATAGVDSRRNCEEYIRQGRVTVDGDVTTDPAQSVDPDQQDVRLDGERLRMPQRRYYLINKPSGVLCTNRDPQGRPRAIDLVPDRNQRLFTVGRLDESTEGLLLITNDGELAQKLAHPRYQVVRRYRAQVAGIPKQETLQQLRDGMHFADGFFRFRTVRILKRRGRSAVLELELREGKNREIRRLLARVGHKVTALERIQFGPLRLGILHSGRYRELSRREVGELQAFVAGEGSGAGRERRSPRKTEAGRSPRGSGGRPRQHAVTNAPARRKSRPSGRRQRGSET